MLYSSMPLDRIYKNQVNSLIIPRNGYARGNNDSVSENDIKILDITHGKVFAKRDGDNYVVHSLSSTDLRDYMNPKYSMGAVIDVI